MDIDELKKKFKQRMIVDCPRCGGEGNKYSKYWRQIRDCFKCGATGKVCAWCFKPKKHCGCSKGKIVTWAEIRDNK